MSVIRPVDYGPLDCIIHRSNEVSRLSSLMVLCRAPANDGWLAIEDHSGVIYNVFDTVAHLYQVTRTRAGDSDFLSRGRQAALLARATWFHHPDAIETVGAPPVVWS